MTALLQQPTVPGKVDGIIALDPMVLQCRRCGETVTQPENRRAALFIILSGYHFHTCTKGAEGRLCPECLAEVVKACGSGRCGA